MDKKLKEFANTYRKENHFDHENGLNFEIKAPGDIEYSMTVLQKHASFKNNGHGGILSALMDATLGLAALSRAVIDDELVSTVEFKMNFLRPIHVGDELVGAGKVEYSGKSLIISHANIYLKGTDKLVAKGLGTFNRYHISKKGLGELRP